MKSYKTYRQHPNPPEGVSPEWVWQVCDGELGGWTVVTDEQFDALMAAYNDSITAWDEWRQQRAVMVSVRDGILTPAMAMGAQIIKEFAAENIALGITQAGMTTRVRLVTGDIVNALSTGSLYDAITAARSIPAESKDPTFVTDVRLLTCVNKIETYLGLPLSSTL
jgi:hypothetical protein